MNIIEIVKFTEEYLKKYSFSKPRLEAEKLIAGVMNVDRINLYIYHDRELTEEEKNDVKKYLKIMSTEHKTFDELNMENKNFNEENSDLLKKSILFLEKYQVPNSETDAEYIFSDVLNCKRSMLKFNFCRKISEEEKAKIKNMIVERAKFRKPLQYILKKWEFFGYEFITDERALIPRQDTEILVEACINLLESFEKPRILDVGVGSGAIAISLAKKIKNSEVIGVDISGDALKLAEENKKINEVDNLKLVKSNLFDAFEKSDKDVGKFDLIVSNPPYISKNEYENLMPEVIKHEPKNALTDDGDGLEFYRSISKNAKKYLKDNGYIAYEIGYNQRASVTSILEKENYEIVLVLKDYSGNDRVVIARKGEKDVDSFEWLWLFFT